MIINKMCHKRKTLGCPSEQGRELIILVLILLVNLKIGQILNPDKGSCNEIQKLVNLSQSFCKSLFFYVFSLTLHIRCQSFQEPKRHTWILHILALTIETESKLSLILLYLIKYIKVVLSHNTILKYPSFLHMKI